MMIKKIALATIFLSLAGSVFAETFCRKETGQNLYVVGIHIGANARNSATHGITVEVIDTNQLDLDPNNRKWVKAFPTTDLDDPLGKYFLAQLREAMREGYSVSFRNTYGDCDKDGFTAMDLH